MVVYYGKATPASGSGGGSGAAVWGAITGTLANQTDLQNALNEKQASLSSDQITATNSGITSALVTQIGTNESAISTINGKIPSAASTENQLADKSFVNSSIATNTANFIGTYEDVATLEAYTGTVTNNDYAFVINSVVKDNGSDWATFASLDAYSKAQLTNFDYAWVINGAKFDLYRFDVINQTWELRVANTDKASVTLNTAYNRYKATVENSTVTWDYEYTLNNSSFTAVQWAAINSGANTTNIGQIATNTTNIGTLQTQAGNAVLTTTAQTLSGAINELDAAMPAAQVNADWTAVSGVSAILNKPNLATVATSGDYTDLSNKPTIPTVNNATLTITQDGTTVGTFTANASSDTTIALTSGSGLQNTATGDYSLTILGTGASAGDDINIGTGSYTASGEYAFSGGNVVIGNNAYSNGDINSSKNNNVVIGKSAHAYGGDNVVIGESAQVINDGSSHNNNVVIGHNASASQNFSIAIGNGSRATGWESIQIGTFNCENAEDNTLYVGFSNANYKMLDSAGKIPNARLDTANLSVGSVENKNTASGSVSPLALWHGTQAEYDNSGVVKDTYYGWENVLTTGGNLPATASWISVAYGDGKFVALGASYPNHIAYSTDGINWLSATGDVTSWSWTSVAYGDGKFVAVATSNVKYGAYSTDGINWTRIELPSQGNWKSVAYGDGKFVAVRTNSNKGAISTDGINWTEITLPNSRQWYSLVYGDKKFVMVAYYSDKAAYSTDGINWTEKSLPANAYWYSLAYGDGKYIAVNFNNGACAYSTDGINWSTIYITLKNNSSPRGICYGNDRFVVTAAGAVGYYSKDGTNWTSFDFSDNKAHNAITYGENMFVTVGYEQSNISSTITFDSVYTDTDTPTTSSQVYSAPDVTSALTITSVGTGTITLSDTYTYNQGGEAYSYYTVGEAYPNYLCFIDGVGVKIGTTFIADYSAPAIGDIETALSQI